jgi:hypothetical protein
MKKLAVLAAMNLTRLGCCAVLAMLLGATLAIPARADTIFNNFGVGICGADAICIAQNGQGPADPVGGATAAHSDIEMIANAFTPGGNFTLTGVTLPLQIAFAGTYNVYLTSDAAGLPGAVLESWIGVSGGAVGIPIPTTTLTSVLNPMLSNGTKYWLVVGPNSSLSEGGWARVIFPEGAAATAANSLANGTPNGSGIPTLAGPWANDDTQFQAFQIDGTPVNQQVPEPATLPLLGVGLIGLVAISRR